MSLPTSQELETSRIKTELGLQEEVASLNRILAERNDRVNYLGFQLAESDARLASRTADLRRIAKHLHMPSDVHPDCIATQAIEAIRKLQDDLGDAWKEAERLRDLLGRLREERDRLTTELTAYKEKLNGREALLADLEEDLRRIAQRLAIKEERVLPTHLAGECLEAIDYLWQLLRKANQGNPPVIVRHVPWGLAGTPGSEQPKEEAICLARAVVDGEIIWVFAEWVRLSNRWVDIADGDPVEVLEYWPLPPSEEGWEQTWRRKGP